MSNTIYNIAGVKIPFNANWDSIAISVSGGADSALLAHLLCSIAPDDFTIHIISHTRMWKTRPWQQRDSLRVYNYLTKKFPNLKFFRHVNLIAPELEYGNIGPSLKDEYGKMVSGDNIQQRAFAEYVCHMNRCYAYYNAVTRNPKDVALDGMQERNVDLTEENSHLEYMVHMGVVASHPFRFVDKSWVLQQYRDLKLMDLFEQTRSCEGEFEGLTYKTYIPGQEVPTCGKCFWCKEREWAVEHTK